MAPAVGPSNAEASPGRGVRTFLASPPPPAGVLTPLPGLMVSGANSHGWRRGLKSCAPAGAGNWQTNGFLCTQPGTRRADAVALVIVLAFIVLVTGVVIAFFSRSIGDTQIANSSANSAKANLFLQSAVDATIGDLKQEMAAGSVTSGNTYLPIAGYPGNVTPYVQADLLPNTNSVARSSSKHPLYGPGPADPANPSYHYTQAATVRAAPTPTPKPNAPANGRNISPARWNKALFLPVTSDTKLDPPGFPAPEWIYVSRNGTNPLAYAPVLTDRTKDTYVGGRYAYMIYNEGATLDLNAAGYPNNGISNPRGGVTTPDHGVSAEQVSRKGSLALADLKQVGLTAAQINTLLAWRNNASLRAASGTTPKGGMTASTTGFYDFVTGKGFTVNDPVGFLDIATTIMSGDGMQTDHHFTSRQELIRFLTQGVAKQSVGGAPAPEVLAMENVLQQVSMFSREVNAPALSASGANVLVQRSFTRRDGTTAQVGEPLLKHRFPLTCINWLSNPASPTTRSADILNAFSLKLRDDGTWGYVDPDNTGAGFVTGVPTIRTLTEVAAAGREPNFFELLNAAIGQGSLGASASSTGPPAQELHAVFKTSQDANKFRQVFEIGLSIIDQYDSDDDPTVMTLGSANTTADITNTMPISGVENLPYPHLIGMQTFKDPTRNAGPSKSYYEAYQQFILWNPHQNAVPPRPTPEPPFRIRANGRVYLSLTLPPAPPSDAEPPMTSDPRTLVDECVYFGMSGQTYSPMAELVPADVDLVDSAQADRFPRGSAAPAAIAFFIGEKVARTADTGDFVHGYEQPLTYSFEKRDKNGKWLPYATIPRIEKQFDDDFTKEVDVRKSMTVAGAPFYSAICCTHSDPRTVRFGMSQGGPASATALHNAYLVPGNLVNTEGVSFSLGPIDDNSGSTPAHFSSNDNFGADLAYNTSAASVRYTDADNILRKADGNTGISFPGGSPYGFGDANPVILNRAFTSVAEMGCAFRGDPWRTLNFYSSDSADNALLDYFTLNETGDVRAGVVDTNNASPSVLKALLANAYHKPAGAAAAATGNYLDDARNPRDPRGRPRLTDVSTQMYKYLHPDLTNSRLKRNALQNLGDLAVMADQLTSPSTSTLWSPINNDLAVDLKANREMLARALSPVSNGRTWNLMLDVVAQPGRLPAAAGSLDKFIAEGERRAWVHLAIDRYTGKVIDKQIEYVDE